MQNKDCKNCGASLYGPVCHQCGQKAIDNRWTISILFGQFVNQLTNIERGFFFTIKALFAFPGRVIKDYWDGKTIIYYNPFRYVLILTALNLLVNFWLGIDDMLQSHLEPELFDHDFEESTMVAADRRFDNWMNFLVLLLIPISSLVTMAVFKRHQQNYAEHLILNAFILGQQGLMSSVTQPIFYFFPGLFAGYFLFYFLIGLIYDCYVFKQTFDEPLWLIILKSILKLKTTGDV